MSKSFTKDMAGNVYGRLSVVRHMPDGGKKSVWLCRCSCGTEKAIARQLLVSGRAMSCGCLSRELAAERNATHGHCKGYVSSKAYTAWQNMRRRCFEKTNKRFAEYGGRGITVCERWLSFENFLSDMGEPPSPKHSIDRVDNHGNYEPGNCRWAQSDVQMKNRRNARLLTFNGRTQNLCDWAAEIGIKSDTLAARIDLYGMSVEEALTKPLHRRSQPWKEGRTSCPQP
jgi:hypothetical protein